MAVAIHPLPTLEAVSNLFEGLFDKEIMVKKVAPASLGKRALTSASSFVDDDDGPAAVCVTDLAFAAYSGAALTMVPVDTAKQSLKAGALPESLKENFYEVMNVFSSLLNTPSTPHLRLKTLAVPPPATLPQEMTVVTKKPTEVVYLEITIADYGTGRLALLVL